MLLILGPNEWLPIDIKLSYEFVSEAVTKVASKTAKLAMITYVI